MIRNSVTRKLKAKNANMILNVHLYNALTSFVANLKRGSLEAVCALVSLSLEVGETVYSLQDHITPLLAPQFILMAVKDPSKMITLTSAIKVALMEDISS